MLQTDFDFKSESESSNAYWQKEKKCNGMGTEIKNEVNKKMEEMKDRK